MTGYNLYGQLIYDTRVPKTVTEDKLEILFYKMRRILGKNDLVSKNFFLNKKLTYSTLIVDLNT